ncbi:MAG: DUF1345 domain-containing protein [Chloroflexi bacterium]|nr:DUF1345 domain-containing protein [Ktedonobacteraceae bacterium]MBV9019645.1 DUF1345 domain-containing protein [Ktedonobacteraceae bacterium]MBV9707777.1 DUF1345 domain-containing protein [Chloroflexota bacterium]
MAWVDETRQQQDRTAHKNQVPIAPRWAAMIALLVFGIVYAALPERLTLEPSWLPLVLVVVLLLPFFVAQLLRHPLPHSLVRTIAFIALAVVTLALAIAVTVLVTILTLNTDKKPTAGDLLRDAALLWLSNILVFALWYWEIDGGGPLKRHQAGHQAADFMFPQQSNNMIAGWAPHFFDYLFVAFTGATALSPADTFPLTRPAKALMMLEAIISFVIIVLLIARSVNIL